jgi:hypothetical protein
MERNIKRVDKGTSRRLGRWKGLKEALSGGNVTGQLWLLISVVQRVSSAC